MKTNITPIGRLGGLAVAVALFAVVATAANAQEKGATKLLQLSAPQVTPVAIASEYKPMSCANCKDSFVAVPDTEIKGAGARALVSNGTPTRIVAKHLCGTCANKWVVKGMVKPRSVFRFTSARRAAETVAPRSIQMERVERVITGALHHN
ncbi:MAG: hypothetical protein DME19_09405 [Verrucomicrobia bacterium]|nr:MAG: hypothetical protein DME19_09405 [Verrucomicrobiota bacterium]